MRHCPLRRLTARILLSENLLGPGTGNPSSVRGVGEAMSAPLGRIFAILAFCLAACASAAAAAEPPRGKIVYTAPSGDLWTMNADGSHHRRLTRSGRATDYSPSWAPNGRRIVFRTARGKYIRD